MKQLLLVLPLALNGASVEPGPDIIYGGRWATIVVETQFMIMKDQGLITPERPQPTVAPKPPLHPIALRPIERHIGMGDLRPAEDTCAGLPCYAVPNVRRKLTFMGIGRKI